MAAVDFLTQTHQKGKRNYLERVVEHNKAECARLRRRNSERIIGMGTVSTDMEDILTTAAGNPSPRT